MLTLQSKVNEKGECSNINIGLRGNFYSGFRAYWVYVMKLLFHEDMNLSILKGDRFHQSLNCSNTDLEHSFSRRTELFYWLMGHAHQ
jgi:hypothetical protein